MTTSKITELSLRPFRVSVNLFKDPEKLFKSHCNTFRVSVNLFKDL